MLASRTIAEELMDDPALDPQVYEAVLTDLARVNRVTMAARPTLAFLKRAVGGKRSFRLLDVGFGNGDMLRAIAQWSAVRGIAADLVGVDLNEKSCEVARKATSALLPITYRTGDYAELAGHRFDCVVSSLVAHHMTRKQLVTFLQFMDQEASAGWFVNDLHRHGVAYTGYPLLAAVMGAHPIVKHDGKLSIARSYRAGEWPPLLTEAGVHGARVFRAFPFRLCVEKIR
ncbi:methyltransferase domain-containing protein [Altererythrobacter sp. HHU K3-1]|uniref:Methyltransferase domain-containing protein n=2 Tax=Qipengyuania atrilutea TaxID=2744473 RepID=A0A850HB11_9SPHN|nr:methyltransferase domain-containing protein [Actirhodobacter atriluteus]NVD44259.1 methyltransferase domain-containing protein [Actirhodobacter atriluteus]